MPASGSAPVAVPALPSFALTNINGQYYWIVGGDTSRLWNGTGWTNC
jgi:hypothetical protein